MCAKIVIHKEVRGTQKRRKEKISETVCKIYLKRKCFGGDYEKGFRSVQTMMNKSNGLKKSRILIHQGYAKGQAYIYIY